MTDFIDVVEHNPIVFVKTVAEQIAKGYSVQNTIPGYPQFGAYGNQIRLFKGEPKGTTVIDKDHSGKVEHYDPMHFMLLLQSFVGAGYKFKDNGQHFFDEKGLKSVEMELVKEEPAKQEVKEEKKAPAKKTTAKKELKAEPTKDELEAE